MLTTFSAKNAVIRVGPVGPYQIMTAKKWVVTPKTDKNDSTNFEGGGFTENGSPGPYSADFTIEFDENAQLNYYDSTLWSPGLHSTSLRLYLNGTSGPSWYFPSYLIEQGPQTADVRQNMAGTITGCNHGPFYYPTGTAGATT